MQRTPYQLMRNTLTHSSRVRKHMRHNTSSRHWKRRVWRPILCDNFLKVLCVENQSTCYHHLPFLLTTNYGLHLFNYLQDYFMWDCFAAGVATSIMLNTDNISGKNVFADMEYMNLIVVTSNKLYGLSDCSIPFFDGCVVPKFNRKKDGVHSGHVQKGLQDPFCIEKNGKGKCQLYLLHLVTLHRQLFSTCHQLPSFFTPSHPRQKILHLFSHKHALIFIYI